MAAIQLDNSNYSNTQARLETQLYSQEQDIIQLKKKVQQLTKLKKDAEKKLMMETQEYENEKSTWQQREADLYNQIRSLNISNEPRTPRTPNNKRRSINSLNMGPFSTNLVEESNGLDTNRTLVDTNEMTTIDEEGTVLTSPKLAHIDSSYAREAKIAQRTIKAQDKLILDLKNQLEKEKAFLQEQQSEAELQSLKITHLEKELANMKQLNRSLMEDNESYQILLHEKTMNGEFMMNPIMQVQDYPIMKQSISSSSNGLNLAAELASSIPEWNSQKETESDKTISKLNEEIKVLQDTNRALQLYMNKILMKIIDNKQLEDVLSIDQPSSKPSTHMNNNSSCSTKSISLKATTTADHSKTTNNNSNRPRRRTISYWGSKPSSNNTTATAASSNSSNKAAAAAAATTTTKEDNKRRHSSIPPPQPERSFSTTTTSSSNGGGWAKALRRMSGIGWSSSSTTLKEESPVMNSEVVHSSSEEETIRKSAGSCNSSIRKSNELLLTTLDEE
ncbi:uncharacterized protein BX663DRAFT_505355 [Cokeromyces recurvatus]|uniref:uncharacterized protein n=1 Tax=Cokeromyces recurvatus TaxID=90255 RepID=UPI00221F042C|nr:uncharacterized protein BX663DRAFT_505355 [Cokeromyces recurvatus]KAI7903824.1 hypothetical protein BX663DRAFT_505355 [Cokeromyces recurvatus]